MGSWMEKFERKQDEVREKQLNENLSECIEKYNDYNRSSEIDKTKKFKLLEDVIEAYKKLIIEACDYNQTDFEQKQKELSTLRYEIMQEKHNESEDSKSWEEYKKEEQDNER